MRYSKLGGQAVIEGVMMKYEKEYSVAVRKPNNLMFSFPSTKTQQISPFHG